MPSRYKFSRHGQSGLEISEALPHLAKVADKITVIRSMHTTHLAHEAALFIMHGGRILPTRPSLGSWITYGLGSENQNLPAYVVLDDPKGPPINFIQSEWSDQLPFAVTRVTLRRGKSKRRRAAYEGVGRNDQDTICWDGCPRREDCGGGGGGGRRGPLAGRDSEQAGIDPQADRETGPGEASEDLL
jgi:hypothetical protein